jgi:hypothetical protein
VLDQAFGHPLTIEEKAAIPFAGGIQQHGYQCGMIWGAALAAGAEAYRRFGSGPEAEVRTMEASRALVEAFRPRHGEIDCFEITHLDHKSSTWEQISFFLLKGGTWGCIKMASWYAPLALDAIERAFASGSDAGGNAAGAPPGPDADSRGPGGTPGGSMAEREPVSCVAHLARMMGASEQHAVMASGLAGGIGLCGGACGALGAAIWLQTMAAAEGGEKVDFRDPRTQEVIDGFLKLTDFEFECEKIVGRTFEDVEDHAAYVRGGGCAAIMEGLSAGGESA